MDKKALKKMKSMYKEHAEQAKEELQYHVMKAQKLCGKWAALYKKEHIDPLLQIIKQLEDYQLAMEKKLRKKAAEGEGAKHDRKRIHGSCCLSTLPGQILPFSGDYGVTQNTLEILNKSKGGISKESAKLPLAVNVLPKKRKRKRRYVPMDFIVDATIKTSPKDVTFVIRDQIISALQMKWGQYTIDIYEIRKDLDWCSQFHPDKDERDAFKLQYAIVSKQIVRLAVAHKLMHYCTRARCKHASEPFMYLTSHGGRLPEIVSCPDEKCSAYWCVNCKKPHHPRVPCDMKERMKEHNKRMQSAYPDGKVRLMACPTCGFLHTKDDACDHVECPLVHSGIPCRTEFCFGCGKPFKGPQGIYAQQGSDKYLDHLIYKEEEGWRCRTCS